MAVTPVFEMVAKLVARLSAVAGKKAEPAKRRPAWSLGT